jgi:hypothetical protein
MRIWGQIRRGWTWLCTVLTAVVHRHGPAGHSTPQKSETRPSPSLDSPENLPQRPFNPRTKPPETTVVPPPARKEPQPTPEPSPAEKTGLPLPSQPPTRRPKVPRADRPEDAPIPPATPQSPAPTRKGSPTGHPKEPPAPTVRPSLPRSSP